MAIPEDLLRRMPADLSSILSTQNRMAGVPLSEQDPATVQTEVISAGPFAMKVYFPPRFVGNTVVFVHFPGGICKSDIDRDRSWCSNMAKDSGAIHVSVNYPSARTVNFQQIFTDCQYAYELVRVLCDRWKRDWDTDRCRIALSGSSIGATLAFGVAAVAALNGQSVLSIVAIVPLVQTHPDHDGPWGENGCTPGLTPERLLKDLEVAFIGVESDFGGHWHSDPWWMPDEVLRRLPKIIMVSARFDILYKSQAQFRDRLQNLGVPLDWKEVDGLHQVKDMYHTQAGREVTSYVTQKIAEIVTQTRAVLTMITSGDLATVCGG